MNLNDLDRQRPQNFRGLVLSYTRIWIVGSGPSARNADIESIPQDDIILGVNGTMEWIPRLDWWFTLDSNPANLNRLNHRRMKSVLCFAALPDHILLPAEVIRFKRLAAERCGRLHRRLLGRKAHNNPEWWIRRWSAVKTLSEHPEVIHTGNSMWGALQVAYHFRPKSIVFVGLDADTSNRVEGGKPNSLLHLPNLFESAVPQLKAAGIPVINASPQSRVTCFPRMQFKQALKETVAA